ncbi:MULTISPECIES: hypothetical protein [unclassified Zunongwangia]|uniref:hypothetical protein n=1 Tax=unclassified Zunongwangia TaxID=2632541 RepID=UPI0022DDFDCD|nr:MULTISPECIES: hypothetical protein [unclassified Zunongwangia]WBL21092.1 hypothetical protein PBT89_10145 [Zunongwangia sp. HRR-M8]WBL27035.1 hypothetical protein PBT91_07125 [Zunongwangia sp. HGR-M22]
MKPKIKLFKEKALEVANQKKEAAEDLNHKILSTVDRQQQLEAAIAETAAILNNIYSKTIKDCFSDSEKQLIKAAENEAMFIIYDAYRN